MKKEKKERNKEKKEKKEREMKGKKTDCSSSNLRRSDGHNSSDKEVKFVYSMRDTL